MRRWLAFSLLILGFAATGLVISSRADLAGQSIHFRDNFEARDLAAWEFPYPEDWEARAEAGNHFLHMLRSREPGVPRRPLQFARLKQATVGSFVFEARLRREGRSMIVVFNYVDTLHFYYAHFSSDRGTEQPIHNGVFIVNGEPRQRIAGIDAPPALPDREWHKVRVARDATSGSIEAFADDRREPLFSVVDRTFTCGQIGIGSFDETGDFDDISLSSNDAGCGPAGIAAPRQLQKRIEGLCLPLPVVDSPYSTYIMRWHGFGHTHAIIGLTLSDYRRKGIHRRLDCEEPGRARRPPDRLRRGHASASPARHSHG
jgi:hypothetical protein